MSNIKKKGLFISLDHNIDIDHIDLSKVNNGIVKKIVYQYQCLQNYGYEMEMLCPYKDRNHRVHSIVRRLPLSEYIPYGKKYINRASEFNFIYLRRPWFMNSDTPYFIRKMKEKNPSLKVVVEVPTYDPASGGKGEINHWHMWPLYWKNNKAIKEISTCADRILTFSRDDEIYGIKTICTCNAINPIATKRVEHVESPDRTIHLVACSSMAFWHGFDRIIEGMKDYKNAGEKDYHIIFHLVGDGEELSNYRNMVLQYGLKDDVIIYGYKSGKELDDIYNLCDIAIDSMGRHRSNVFYNSSLKGKEYLAKGLPVISGVKNELDDDPYFKYYLRVPADDSPVDMKTIIDFYNNVYNSGEKRINIISYISDYAAEHFSYEASFRTLVDYLNS